jgi:hypothetical protein
MTINVTDSPQLKADKRLTIRVDEHAEDCSSWETDFVEAMVKQLEEGRAFSPDQRRKMEQIDEERVE